MTDTDDVRDELRRLRTIVGPDEAGYEQLRSDRDAAVEVARDAERELGRQRGANEELRVQLARARQDQDHLQLALEERDRLGRAADRVRSVVRRWTPWG